MPKLGGCNSPNLMSCLNTVASTIQKSPLLQGFRSKRTRFKSKNFGYLLESQALMQHFIAKSLRHLSRRYDPDKPLLPSIVVLPCTGKQNGSQIIQIPGAMVCVRFAFGHHFQVARVKRLGESLLSSLSAEEFKPIQIADLKWGVVLTCLGTFKHSTGDALRPKFNALGCPSEQIGDLAWPCDMCRCTCQSKGHTKAKKK